LTALPDAIELLKIRRSVKPREMSGPGPRLPNWKPSDHRRAGADHGKLTPWRFIVSKATPGFAPAKSSPKCLPGKIPRPCAEAEIEKRRSWMPAGDRRGQLHETASQGAAWEQELSAGASAMNSSPPPPRSATARTG